MLVMQHFMLGDHVMLDLGMFHIAGRFPPRILERIVQELVVFIRPICTS